MLCARRWAIRVQDQLSHLTAQQFDDHALRTDIRMSATRSCCTASAIMRMAVSAYHSARIFKLKL
jgi:hypothetical protein